MAGVPHPQVLTALYAEFPDALLHTDVNRVIVACNRAALALFGYEAEELIGLSVERIYARREDFDEQGILRFTEDAHVVEASPYEMHYRDKNGRVF